MAELYYDFKKMLTASIRILGDVAGNSPTRTMGLSPSAYACFTAFMAHGAGWQSFMQLVGSPIREKARLL